VVATPSFCFRRSAELRTLPGSTFAGFVFPLLNNLAQAGFVIRVEWVIHGNTVDILESADVAILLHIAGLHPHELLQRFVILDLALDSALGTAAGLCYLFHPYLDAIAAFACLWVVVSLATQKEHQLCAGSAQLGHPFFHKVAGASNEMCGASDLVFRLMVEWANTHVLIVVDGHLPSPPSCYHLTARRLG